MSSTTEQKKDLVHFLWDWAETKGSWGQLLITKIISNEKALQVEDRKEIFGCFLESINLHPKSSTPTIQKPTYAPKKKTIVLESLSNIEGVNRLAKEQTINFARNITIVYGENGTGKTGYSRVLKILGLSYDNKNNILPDISTTDNAQSQAATIQFKANDKDKTFLWNGTNSDPDLKSIAVFNNNCVHISLQEDRQLIVSPIGFRLFDLITYELNELEKLLRNKKDSYETNLSWIGNLTDGTPQQLFITKLDSKSSEEELNKLATFTASHIKDLENKEKALSNLNKTLISKEITELTSFIKEIQNINGTIKNTKLVLNDKNWQSLIQLHKKIKTLESKTQVKIKDIAEKNGIEFYNTQEFKDFIKAAEYYIKIIEKPNYPSSKDSCIYCLQPLEDSSQDLIKKYRALMKDTTRSDLLNFKSQRDSLITQVNSINTDFIFHHPSFGSKDQAPIQPVEIEEYKSKIKNFQKQYSLLTAESFSTFQYDYNKYTSFLSAKEAELNSTLTGKQTSLLNLSSEEAQLKNVIVELKDRKILSEKISEIKNIISNYKIIDILNKHNTVFNSSSISHKTSETRKYLIEHNFNSIFTDELSALNKSHLQIDLQFGTIKGNSQISPTIHKYPLTEILSEGEQKAIALAEFITELSLDNINAPVIFDDPVNSLDHKIIDEVAKRLLNLSTNKQVIVFTHSILLFNSFLHLKKQKTQL